jgi:hypothetical protein
MHKLYTPVDKPVDNFQHKPSNICSIDELSIKRHETHAVGLVRHGVPNPFEMLQFSYENERTSPLIEKENPK